MFTVKGQCGFCVIREQSPSWRRKGKHNQYVSLYRSSGKINTKGKTIQSEFNSEGEKRPNTEGWKVKIDGTERGGLPGSLQVILPVVVTKEISNTEKVDPYTDFKN